MGRLGSRDRPNPVSESTPVRTVAAYPRSSLICSLCAPPLLLPFALALAQVCTEAGMFAIRVERNYVIEEDLLKAVRKIAEVKKLEGKLDYEKV